MRVGLRWPREGPDEAAAYLPAGWTASLVGALAGAALFGVIPMMFALPYFHRYFFRVTGRVYLGPMVTCLVFVMMMLTNNVCYIPH